MRLTFSHLHSRLANFLHQKYVILRNHLAISDSHDLIVEIVILLDYYLLIHSKNRRLLKSDTNKIVERDPMLPLDWFSGLVITHLSAYLFHIHQHLLSHQSLRATRARHLDLQNATKNRIDSWKSNPTQYLG
jgi:hypothetical protein